MNHAQQNYYRQKKVFSNSVSNLGFGTIAPTQYYDYSTYSKAGVTYNYGIARTDNLKSFVRAVFVPSARNLSPVNPESGLASILCQTNSPTKTQPDEPLYKNGELTCPPGTEEVKAW